MTLQTFSALKSLRSLTWNEWIGFEFISEWNENSDTKLTFIFSDIFFIYLEQNQCCDDLKEVKCMLKFKHFVTVQPKSWGGYWADDRDSVNNVGYKLFFGKGVRLFIQSSKNKKLIKTSKSFNFSELSCCWCKKSLVWKKKVQTVREAEGRLKEVGILSY